LDLDADPDAEPDDDEFEDESDDADTRKVRKRHKFEALVDFVANRDGTAKSKAMEIARRDYPETYASYQDSAKVEKSFESLVAVEMRKGFSAVVAKQKVAYAFPDLAKSAAAIAKSASGVVEFVKCVDQIQARDDCSRTAAMAKARQEYPTAFARYQNV